MKSSLFRTLMSSMMIFALSTFLEASDPTVRLPNHVPIKAMKNAVFSNDVEAQTHVPITFVLPLRNQEELQELIDRIYDPSDQEHYGNYISSAEFIERFAPTQEDYDRVVAYAKSVGLTIQGTHPNRILLNAHGAAQTVESAFNLQLHHYQLPNGRKFHAPNQDPEVPMSIASTISGIVGLSNHAKWHTYNHRKEMLQPSSSGSKAFPSGPGGGFSPNDLITAYNLSGVKASGSNQIIALFELADYQNSDITTYTTYFGLPAPKLKRILVDGGSGAGIDPEVTLDIELALALAPESTIYVYEGPNSGQGVLDTYNKIATDNLAKQVSTSWGEGEDNMDAQSLQAENTIFQQMAAQGQTIYAAAGDSGAYDDYSSGNPSKTLVVDDPASQPYIVGVGGTSLIVNTQTGSYQSESVWNDGLGNGAGGGGVSTVWKIPSWQTNVPTIYSKTNRNVPDVALNADTNTGYAIYYDGQWQIYGGTSCAAPLWAAFTSCVNQQLAAALQPSVGFANPKLYAIGTGGAYMSDFHDVTKGNNLHYNALVGYDNASGWGSFNGSNLFASLTQASTSPLFNLVLKHNASFTKGEIGTYRIVVSNAGAAAASGPVSVAISLPTGLTYNSFSGTGWVFNNSTLTFSQNTALNPGQSYPTIVLNVNVAKTAPSQVVPTATLSVDNSVTMTVTNLTTTH